MLVPSELVVIDPDVYILALWIPDFELEASVKILPDAFSLLAVIESIISILSTVAPLIKISSDSDLISYKLPNPCNVWLGTTTIVTKSGAFVAITYVLSSEK